MAVILLNDENFEKEVLNSGNAVLIDFFATWCGPCRMLSPIIDEIAIEYDDIKVCKVDVDESPNLAARFAISSVPTVVVFKNGELYNTSVGVKPKAEILKMFE